MIILIIFWNHIISCEKKKSRLTSVLNKTNQPTSPFLDLKWGNFNFPFLWFVDTNFKTRELLQIHKSFVYFFVCLSTLTKATNRYPTFTHGQRSTDATCFTVCVCVYEDSFGGCCFTAFFLCPFSLSYILAFLTHTLPVS